MVQFVDTGLTGTMLALGRLDGRLHRSSVADIFLARARLEGAAALSALAGVPVSVSDLQAWIAGRSPPPRASEGLNDPISVAAVFHLALTRDAESRDPLLRATLNTLRSVLNDRGEAETYGGEDLAYFGPMWRKIRERADARFDGGGLDVIAARIFEIAKITEATNAAATQVTTLDGRSLTLPPSARDRTWLIATAVPWMLWRAGLTLRVIPSFVLLPRFLPSKPGQLTPLLEAALRRAITAGFRDLDDIEQAAGRLITMDVTKRSKAPLLARLELAYPGLQPRAVARLLDVTPQGARKLLAGQRRTL